jgi:4-amino-4-deoxy-L-arabinose transferase-like glycosyltransferase
MNQPFWWDEADYLSAAKRWGLGLNIRDIWYYRRGFLFPLIGALIFKLGLGEIGMRFLIVLFSTGIVAVSYLIISKMFNKKLALLTSIGLSLSWILLFFTGRVLTDIPAAFFILLSLLFFWKGYVLKEGNKFLYLFGFVFALAVLTRMQSLMLIPPFLIYIFINEKSKAFKNKKLWITLGIFLLMLVPQFILYALHYGNPLSDLAAHYLGIGASNSAYSGDQRGFSGEVFNYFANLPYMLSTPIFILLLFGTIYFFADLFIGFDKISKNEELKKKLFVLLWVVSLFLIMGYIGSISYVEQRYITAGLPFLLLIAVSLLLFIANIIIKKFAKHKKIIMFAVFASLILISIPSWNLANSLIDQQKASYLPIQQVGEMIKADSTKGDIVMSTSLPQITYYSELSVYPYDIKNDSIAKGDKSIANYKDGEAGFEQFLKDKKPKYLMASVFESDPDWILIQGVQNNVNIISMPFFNSSISYNTQTSQLVSIDLKPEVKKEGMSLSLFYPSNPNEINGIFVYKVGYS